MKDKKYVFRSHVYEVDFGTENRVGSEYKKRRPCVVVSNEMNNLYSPTICVVPLTSKQKNNIPTHTTLKREDYQFLWEETSTAMCECITTVSRERMGKFIGVVKEEDMLKINKCLKIQLELS